jgi:hypothetical protein
MRSYFAGNKRHNKYIFAAVFSLAISVLASCATIDPARVDIQIDRTHPIPKITSYTEALARLGVMTQIYDTRILKVQSIPISDNTGSSRPTEGEIPKDITEMVKSALNSIGGNLVYIPYDPGFVQNQIVTGYSNFQRKLIPEVVITGGITEFDRGLETREKNTDASARLEYEGLSDYLPGAEGEIPYPTKETHFKYEGQRRVGLARITLDFNLLDFQSMSGISKMNAVNTMEVHKATATKELGISIFGQSFGRKGKLKKVQGRHAAIRLLVELSMIQIIGRQLVLPYWQLLGDDALPDQTVLKTVSSFYRGMNFQQKILFTQQQLFLHGYDVPVNGSVDNATARALKAFYKIDAPAKVLNRDDFIKLWAAVPINETSLARRRHMTDLFQAAKEKQRKLAQKKRMAIKKKTRLDAKKKQQQSMTNKIDRLLRILEEKRRNKAE